MALMATVSRHSRIRDDEPHSWKHASFFSILELSAGAYGEGSQKLCLLFWHKKGRRLGSM